MRTIYKYQVPIESESWLLMPSGAEIRHVDVVASELFVWAEIDTDEIIKNNRGFAVRGTGYPIELNQSWKFLGTAIDRHLGLVWHVFAHV